jgi:hypothetical protein
MIADLLHHREANQNGGAPLILRVDVPRLRQIANKRMGFLKATYRAFKVSASVEDDLGSLRTEGSRQRRQTELDFVYSAIDRGPNRGQAELAEMEAEAVSGGDVLRNTRKLSGSRDGTAGKFDI